MQQEITVHSSRVDLVAAAAQKTMLLLQKDIVLSGDSGQGVTYKFNGLNAIKPGMITEATRNSAPPPTVSLPTPAARLAPYGRPTRAFLRFSLLTRQAAQKRETAVPTAAS